MNKTKTILGLILAWALSLSLLSGALAQVPTVKTMHTAATATGNGTPLLVDGPAGNPANTLGAAGVQVANASGTFEVTFEVLTSGSTWTAVMATNLTDDVRATTTTAAGQYTILLGGAVQLRARISACSSCSVTVTGRLVPGLVARMASGGVGGIGDVVGPVSATDNALARFNATTGKLLQNSVVLVGDTGNVTGLGTLNAHTIPGGTDTFTLNAAAQSLSNKTLIAPVIGSGGATITKVLTGSASLDFGATAAGACDVLTITVTGAVDGNPVFIGVPNALAAADNYQMFTCYVSAADTVTVKRCNLTNVAMALSNPAAATVTAMVFQ